MTISSFGDGIQTSLLNYLEEPEGNCLAYREGKWHSIPASQAKAGGFASLFPSSKISLKTVEYLNLCFENDSLRNINKDFKDAARSTARAMVENINDVKRSFFVEEFTAVFCVKAKGKIEDFEKKIQWLNESDIKGDYKALCLSLKIAFETRVLEAFQSKMESRDTALVEELLKTGKVGSTVIHTAFKLAVDKGFHEMIPILLAYGCVDDTDVQQAFLKTAANEEHLETVKVLIKHGNIAKRSLKLALRSAVSSNKVALVRVLLENIYFDPTELKIFLDEAVKKGFNEIVKSILAADTSKLFLSDESCMTGLYQLALEKGKLEIFHHLLLVNQHGIFPKDKITAFHQAVQNGHMALVEILLNDIPPKDIEKSIRTAAKEGHKVIFETLVEKAPSAECINDALIEACDRGQSEIVEVILVSVNHALDLSSLVRSFLQAAASNHARVIDMLLKSGLLKQLNEKDYSNLVIEAFKKAIEQPCLTTLSILLTTGVALDTLSRAKAVEIAVCASWLQLVQALLKNGDIPQEVRLKALINAAARKDNLAMINCLLEKGYVALAKDLLLAHTSIDASNKHHIYNLILRNADPIIPKEILFALAKCRNDKMQDYLMLYFVQTSNEKLAEVFAEIPPKKDNYLLIALCIDSLTLASDQKKALLQIIMELEQIFKDFLKRDLMLRTLVALQTITDPELLQQTFDLLLTLLLQKVSHKDKWKAFLQFSNIAISIPSILPDIKAENLYEKGLASLIIANLKHLLPPDVSEKSALTDFLRLRNPGAFFTYLSKFKDDPDLAPVLRILIAGLIKGTFQADRNAHNSHKQYLSDQELLQWQTPHFISESSIIDSDNFEDLFLCGTEIAGSCQSVYEDPRFCKCLMGNVIDGKVRILAKKTDKGTIVARAILKIVLTDTNEPALFLERSYGGDEASRQQIKTMALSKARALGIDLFEHCAKSKDSGPGLEPELVQLTSAGNAAPFEYEDGLGPNGVTQGKYAITARKLILQQGVT